MPQSLIDDIQRLALYAEWAVDVNYDYNNSHNGNRIKLEIIKSKYVTPINFENHIEETLYYTGNVYCFEVPSHIFYVRRNGKPVWTGNCSSHGQKGVVGMIISQENMPFTKDGIVPDIIINPHAFPSRMTIGHVMETVFAKLCCMEGTRGDGTVFMPFDKEAVFNSLEEHGFQKHGNEVLYNGRTGEQIKTEVFIGPIYYYRLKHMVTDKIHSRSTGPKVQLTHQPTSGRSSGGGLRIGEMERDVLLSHGLSQFTKECMMEKSDKYRWGVCRHCGTLSKYTPSRNLIECLNCGLQDISVVETPYAFKLLIQEMEAMGVQIRLSDESIQEYGDDTNQEIYYESDNDENDDKESDDEMDEENNDRNHLIFKELYEISEEQEKENEDKSENSSLNESDEESDNDVSEEEMEESDESILEGGYNDVIETNSSNMGYNSNINFTEMNNTSNIPLFQSQQPIITDNLSSIHTNDINSSVIPTIADTATIGIDSDNDSIYSENIEPIVSNSQNNSKAPVNGNIDNTTNSNNSTNSKINNTIIQPPQQSQPQPGTNNGGGNSSENVKIINISESLMKHRFDSKEEKDDDYNNDGGDDIYNEDE